MTKPNTFIIGAPKCGTTALAHYLSEHPAVYFSKPKEPFYWSGDIPRSKHELQPHSLSEYLKLFDGADPKKHRVVAEGSTRYIRSKIAVNQILEFNSESKFIAMIRNPIEVVQSFHMEQLYVQHEDVKNFAEAWLVQDDREKGRMMPKNSTGADYVLYRKVASFAEQVERFFRTVPESQRKLIIFDDLKSNPKDVYAGVLDFLSLPDDGRTDFSPVNSSHAQRWPALSRFYLYPPRPLEEPFRNIRRYLLQHNVPGIKWIKSKLNVKRERVKVDESILSDVQNYFREDIEKLSVILQRDLSHWLESTNC